MSPINNIKQVISQYRLQEVYKERLKGTKLAAREQGQKDVVNISEEAKRAALKLAKETLVTNENEEAPIVYGRPRPSAKNSTA